MDECSKKSILLYLQSGNMLKFVIVSFWIVFLHIYPDKQFFLCLRVSQKYKYDFYDANLLILMNVLRNPVYCVQSCKRLYLVMVEFLNYFCSHLPKALWKNDIFNCHGMSRKNKNVIFKKFCLESGTPLIFLSNN